MEVVSDMPELPDCVLETSNDVFEVLAHNWTNCTKCLYEQSRKMVNNQEVLFEDRKPFWVIEREQKQAELAAIQQQEAERRKAEEAEQKKQLADEGGVENELSKGQKKKKKKKGKNGGEEEPNAAPSSAEAQPSAPTKHICYTKMAPQTRHHAIQQMIKSGKATSKNEAKWQLIRLCTDQCRKVEEGETVDKEKEKDKVPLNKMPWVSQFKYPKRISTLTKALHKRYVAIKLNQAKGGAGRFGFQGSEINEMDEKLRQERVEFNKFVMEWMGKKSTRHEHLPGSAQRFLVNRSKTLLEQLYGIYSSRPVCQIPLATVDVLNVSLWWPQVVTQLVELGTRPVISVSNLHRKAVFDVSVNRQLEEYPHDIASVSSVESDETANKLARKHGARFVMSAATARLLFLQVPFNRPPNWDIPIIVKKDFVQGRMQPVIYFCKPLPTDGCNAMQLWWRYVKMAVKSNFLNGLRSDSSNDEPDQLEENVGEDEIFSDSADTRALDKLETFGVSSPKRKSVSGEKSAAESGRQQNSLPHSEERTSRSPSPQLPPSAAARIPKRRTRAQAKAAKVARLDSDHVADESMGSDTEQRLTIDVDEDDEKEERGAMEIDSPVAPSPNTDNIKPSTPAESSADPSTDLLDSIFSKMPKPQPKAGKSNERNDQFVEDPADYDAPENLRTARRYVLAQINNCGPILIRSNADGLVNDMPVSFAPKLEYAPEHGAEIMSEDEWLWHWTTALLKGSKQHLIASVHFSDAHCLQIDTIRTADWIQTRLSEERKFLIASRSKYLADLLNRVGQLDDGEYLLQRRADKDHITVVQKVDHLLKTPEMLDLSELGKDQRQWSKKGELPPFEQRFLGIDPSKLLVWHRVLSRIPATFFPRLDDQKPNLTDGSFSKKGKKGGNKWNWKKNKQKDKKGAPGGGTKE